MHRNTQRVQQVLDQFGAQGPVRVLPDSTRTAAEAAAALDVEQAQIAKSLVFLADGEPIMVIASGTQRVATDKVAAHLGAVISRADAQIVKAATGFTIGGVAPIAHTQPLRILLDVNLRNYDELWAAAGTPRSVFRTDAEELGKITGGEWLDVAE